MSAVECAQFFLGMCWRGLGLAESVSMYRVDQFIVWLDFSVCVLGQIWHFDAGRY